MKKFARACIPLGYAWSSPFVRWQGALAEISSLDLAVAVTRSALKKRGLLEAQDEFTEVVFGLTVPQETSFYGTPTIAARIGYPGLSGPMIAQACATSLACLQHAAMAVEIGSEPILVVMADRTSNGPLLIYPSAKAPAGAPRVEHWMLDSFRRDPWGGKSMLETAEGVAKSAGIGRQEMNELVLLRCEQYQRALANDREFQKRYMTPVEIAGGRGQTVIDQDIGAHPTTAEGLDKLKPVLPDGVLTYGMQTFPADGAAGMVVADEDRARALSGDAGIARILGTGFSRVGKAEMPKASAPAALAALKNAGVSLKDVDMITTHSPFTVNDIWFSRETGYALDKMNSFGCSLVYGHPQAATGARAMIELIEALRMRGGGVGLFTGCAAGDTAGAVVLRVED